MNDNIGPAVFYLALAVLAGYWYVRKWLAKTWRNQLTLPNGRTYTYVMGDYMRLYGARGTFHGIDVVLPKELPHIYLDSLKGGGRQVRLVFDPQQRIALEGDFNRYFNVFVPKRYEAVALSILSPDVMVTLRDYAVLFDVEIYGNHMRIISNKRVAGNHMLQDLLMIIAVKVMEEVDQRLASWTPAGERDALAQDLRIYPGGGIRIGGSYITYWTIGWTVYWFFVTLGIGAAGVLVLAVGGPEHRGLGGWLLGVFVVLLAVLVMYTRRRWRQERFRSKRQ